MSQISRRRFLYVLAGGSAGLFAGAPLWQSFSGRLRHTERTTGVAQEIADARHRSTRTAWALGSNVTISALHEDEERATAGVDEAFAELETVERVMSIYRSTSQLSRLNQNGQLEDPHPYLVDILRVATAMSARTEGAFDVTIQPLWQAYWAAHERGTQPTTGQIAAARQCIDWRCVEVTDARIRLHGQQMAVTLNGLAQGFAADRATAALRRQGIEHALIDTGEFGALGHGADPAGWSVGIQHPRREAALVAVASLSGRCLATSGDYATRFDNAFTKHHLLDPRTGDSATELSSVSIVAETGLAADALSTAAFVLGFDRGRSLVAATPGADAMFVSRSGRTWISPGFPLREPA